MASFWTGFHWGTMQNCNQTGCFQTYFGSFWEISIRQQSQFESHFEPENFEIEIPRWNPIWRGLKSTFEGLSVHYCVLIPHFKMFEKSFLKTCSYNAEDFFHLLLPKGERDLQFANVNPHSFFVLRRSMHLWLMK